MTTASATASGTPAAQAAGTNATAASSLGSNLTDFLKLLMTQLQNQDPTQPLDTNQFTTQLVQFANVEQQINANTNLTTLIQLSQGGQLLQAGALVGKQVEATSDTLALQSGTAQLALHPAASGPVTVTISSPQGVPLRTVQVAASTSGTSWSWDGASNTGQMLPDGAYKVAVTNADGSQVPFGVVGTVSSVQRNGAQVQAQIGALQVSIGNIQATS